MSESTTELDPSKLSDEQLREWMMRDLPEEMRVAQRAIESPEVREIIRRLAVYNLGVVMPHMHVRQGTFVPMPSGTVALENKTDFVPESESAAQYALPVAWRWADGDVEVVGSCHVNKRKCDS